MPQLENSSPLGRLLEEISWEGNAKPYREGGRGRENVLTVETLTPLNYLPRAHFLGQVILAAHGAQEARRDLVKEIERAELSLLPGDVTLGRSGVRVQPDATINGHDSYALVEAKRIRRATFQTDQLAREYVAALQEAQGRRPLLLLVLGSPPPVLVRGYEERVEIPAAIATRLTNVAAREELGLTDDQLIAKIPEVTAWITWSEIRAVVVRARERFPSEPAFDGTLRRLCEAVLTAIDWHS